MLLGFALTQHCNLRCPHCIRDDVLSVHSIDTSLLLRSCDDALTIFGEVTASFTGGEPTLHHEWDAIVAGVTERRIPYRFVSNGWHMRRLMPSIDRWPPAYVRLSLSGASTETHDDDRGRDSFRRVLIAVALLTSRQVPTALSIVIDRRNRHEVRAAADLAEALGCLRLHYILPQPVPGSIARNSDLVPVEWHAVKREIIGLAAEKGRRTAVVLDYGSPALDGEPETLCDTMSFKRAYVDAYGRLSLCCQLSEYGFSDSDVVADLNRVSLRDAWARYQGAIGDLATSAAAPNFAGPIAALPCMRCAHALGKLGWLAEGEQSEWQQIALCR